MYVSKKYTPFATIQLCDYLARYPYLDLLVAETVTLVSASSKPEPSCG